MYIRRQSGPYAKKRAKSGALFPQNCTKACYPPPRITSFVRSECRDGSPPTSTSNVRIAAHGAVSFMSLTNRILWCATVPADDHSASQPRPLIKCMADINAGPGKGVRVKPSTRSSVRRRLGGWAGGELKVLGLFVAIGGFAFGMAFAADHHASQGVRLLAGIIGAGLLLGAASLLLRFLFWRSNR